MTGVPPQPPHPRAPRPSPLGDPALEPLLISAVTLVIGWSVALWMLARAGSDLPDGFFSDVLPTNAPLLVMVVAMVAVLLSWGEVDLSMMGFLPFGVYLHTQNADEGLVVVLLLAGLGGLLLGAGIGIVRSLTRAPSALLTFAAGWLMLAYAGTQLVDDRPGYLAPGPHTGGRVEGWGLPLGLAAVVVGLALALAGWRRAPDGSVDAATTGPRLSPGLVVGYALSGLAATLTGAVAAGVDAAARDAGELGMDVSTVGSSGGIGFLLFIVGGLAFGGVTRRSGMAAPVGAALGIVGVYVLGQGLEVVWVYDPFDSLLLMSAVVFFCLVVAYGMRQAMDASGARMAGGAPVAPVAPVAYGAPYGAMPPVDRAPADSATDTLLNPVEDSPPPVDPSSAAPPADPAPDEP